MRKLIVLAVLALTCLLGQTTPTLGSIKKIFIDKMDNDLDQYLRAEFVK